MIIVVTGGRTFGIKKKLDETLNRYFGQAMMIVHGGAPGADMLAGVWAQSLFVPCLKVPANWALQGRAAGPIRNREMLIMAVKIAKVMKTYAKVIAFEGGKGTANCIATAEELGIEVERV